MSEVFSEEIKQGFVLAKRLELIGETNLAMQLCTKCVEAVAYCNGVDLLQLFYGANVYNDINTISDAMNCAFVARCAEEAYNSIYSKLSMDSCSGAWAKRGVVTDCPMLVEVFEWLQRSDRKPDDRDVRYFERIIKSMKDADAIHFKIASRLTSYKPVDIIRGLVQGSVFVARDGGLV